MNNPCTRFIEHRPYPFIRPLWWPFDVNFTNRDGLRFFVRLPGGWHVQTKFFLEDEDVKVWAWRGLMITRPETPQEEQDRLDAWAEDAFMEYELNRYTQWAY